MQALFGGAYRARQGSSPNLLRATVVKLTRSKSVRTGLLIAGAVAMLYYVWALHHLSQPIADASTKSSSLHQYVSSRKTAGGASVQRQQPQQGPAATTGIATGVTTSAAASPQLQPPPATVAPTAAEPKVAVAVVAAPPSKPPPPMQGGSTGATAVGGTAADDGSGGPAPEAPEPPDAAPHPMRKYPFRGIKKYQIYRLPDKDLSERCAKTSICDGDHNCGNDGLGCLVDSAKRQEKVQAAIRWTWAGYR